MEPSQPDRAVLDLLAERPAAGWKGTVWRHTFGTNRPDRPNSRGARWNPPGTDALYTSLGRDTALAEAEHQIQLQPVRPKARRTIHRLEVSLAKVLDLTDPDLLASLGVDRAALESLEFGACQRVGGAAARLGYEGILVPSARHPGTNLVVFVGNLTPHSRLDVVSSEEIGPAEQGPPGPDA